MDTKRLGLEPASGGARLITLAEVLAHRSYVAKDNTTKFVTTLIYGGGNRSVMTTPEHPLYQTPVGQKVLMFEHFLEDRFGWKPQGDPQLLELNAK